MKKLLKAVLVGGVWYKINYAKYPLKINGSNHKYDGTASYENCRISIQKQATVHTWKVLWHEIGHAFAWEYDLFTSNEVFCDSFAGLMMTIKFKY